MVRSTPTRMTAMTAANTPILISSEGMLFTGHPCGRVGVRPARGTVRQAIRRMSRRCGSASLASYCLRRLRCGHGRGHRVEQRYRERSEAGVVGLKRFEQISQAGITFLASTATVASNRACFSGISRYGWSCTMRSRISPPSRVDRGIPTAPNRSPAGSANTASSGCRRRSRRW